MTTVEYRIEHRHVYQTRLGILEAPQAPTAEQHNLAVAEADAHVAALKEQEKQEGLQLLRGFREAME